MVDLTKLNEMDGRMRSKFLAHYGAPKYMQENCQANTPPEDDPHDGYAWVTQIDGVVHEHEYHLVDAHKEAGAIQWHHIPIVDLEDPWRQFREAGGE